jgi:hypothetical protein
MDFAKRNFIKPKHPYITFLIIAIALFISIGFIAYAKLDEMESRECIFWLQHPHKVHWDFQVEQCAYKGIKINSPFL